MPVSDGSERQIIKDMDGTVPRAKIKACSICDPYVLIVREDDTIGLFIDAQRGRVRRKDMSPMGDKVILNLPLSRHPFSCACVKGVALLGRMFLQRYL